MNAICDSLITLFAKSDTLLVQTFMKVLKLTLRRLIGWYC
jgi:hypothetical protein